MAIKGDKNVGELSIYYSENALDDSLALDRIIKFQIIVNPYLDRSDLVHIRTLDYKYISEEDKDYNHKAMAYGLALVIVQNSQVLKLTEMTNRYIKKNHLKPESKESDLEALYRYVVHTAYRRIRAAIKTYQLTDHLICKINKDICTVLDGKIVGAKKKHPKNK